MKEVRGINPIINESADHVAISECNLSRAISWTSVADQKAAFVLTLTVVILGFLTTQLNDFFNAVFGKWNASPSAPAVFILLIVIMVVALVGMTGAIINLVVVIRPRVTPASAVKSILFFQTISGMLSKDFAKELTSLDREAYVYAVCDQTHNVSKVVTEKFRKLTLSITWFWIGMAAVVLFSFLRPLLIRLL